MKKLLFVFTCSFIFSCTAQENSKNEFSKLKNPALNQRIDSLVFAYQNLDIFSGVVLIAEKGKPYYHKAFGLADRKNKIPNKLDTRFDIGSMNKSFTKVLILQLISEGKLDLDDPLGKFLKGFKKEVAEKVKVKHLLNHTSGLVHYHTPQYWDLPIEEKGIDGALKVIRTIPLEFEPGTDQAYSNAGYVLLGAIVEKVEGKSFADVVENRITKPLQLKDTYLRDKYSVPNRAIGYFKNIKGEIQDNEYLQEQPTPAGGFYSTTIDILRFYRAMIYTNDLLPAKIKEKDEQFQFYEANMENGGAITHAGGFEGANTVHYEILRDQISIIVFANMDEVVAEDLGMGILQLIRGKQPKSPQLPAEQCVYQAYNKYGIDFVKQHWDSLTQNFHPADPKDLILNQIGYEFLFEERVDAAIELFALNTQLFPSIANCWDSLGEGYLFKNELEKSELAYKKALEIRPNLMSAKKGLKEIAKKRAN